MAVRVGSITSYSPPSVPILPQLLITITAGARVTIFRGQVITHFWVPTSRHSTGGIHLTAYSAQYIYTLPHQKQQYVIQMVLSKDGPMTSEMCRGSTKASELEENRVT